MNSIVSRLLTLIEAKGRAINTVELGRAAGVAPTEVSRSLRELVERGKLILSKDSVQGRSVNAYSMPAEGESDGIKVSLMEQRVMIAMRAAYISGAQLDRRFGGSGTTAANALVRKGLAERYADGWAGEAFRLTVHGRELCPTRRALAGLGADQSAQETRHAQ